MNKRVLLLLVIFWLSSFALAQGQHLEVDISGMACKFCAHNVEKHLSKLDGVKQVSVNLDKGIAIIIMVPDKQVNVGQIKKIITKAGFTPGDVRVVKNAQ